MSEDDFFIICEIYGNIDDSVFEEFKKSTVSDVIDVGVGSGLSAERVLLLIGKACKPAKEAIRTVVTSLLDKNKIKGLRVRKGEATLEIESIDANDLGRLGAFLETALGNGPDDTRA